MIAASARRATAGAGATVVAAARASARRRRAPAAGGALDPTVMEVCSMAVMVIAPVGCPFEAPHQRCLHALDNARGATGLAMEARTHCSFIRTIGSHEGTKQRRVVTTHPRGRLRSFVPSCDPPPIQARG